MAHVSDQKKKVVESFVKLMKDYPIVGAIDLEGMPTAQLQKVRATLRDNDMVLLVSKRRIMKIAIEKAKKDKKGIEELEANLKGMPAMIFSKKDPFKLYKLLKSSKSEAPAKAGQIAPKDIEIKAGVTNFLPGPIISELASVGVKSGVENGKVAIKQDCIVCKEGKVITAKLAEMLTRLNIKPMEVGLNLIAAYENGVIFKKSVLDIDEAKYLADITQAASESFNLSVETGYFTKENVDVIIRNVFYTCKALAEESKFMADVVVEDMLASAERSAKSLKSEANIEVSEKKAEPKKEHAPKTVEKKYETPSEKHEEKVLEEEKEIIKEEKKLEEKPKERLAPVEKEIKHAVKEEEEKVLEEERIEKEEEVEKIEEQKLSTDDKIAKMVKAQKKHATGEDKKESAEALVEETKSEEEKARDAARMREAQIRKEVSEVENIYEQLKQGKSIKPKVNHDYVPTAAELAAKRRK